jgi:hypothetical protein
MTADPLWYRNKALTSGRLLYLRRVSTLSKWRFHFRGSYFGLRGVLENATNSRNLAVVNNIVDSPQFGTFSEFPGRAPTARIRLISSK